MLSYISCMYYIHMNVRIIYVMTYDICTCTIRISLYLFPLLTNPPPKAAKSLFIIVGFDTKLFFTKGTCVLVVQVDSLVCVFRYTVLRKSIKYITYPHPITTPMSRNVVDSKRPFTVSLLSYRYIHENLE